MDPRTEYVMVLDADAIPFPDAIQSFLPYFYEKRNGNGHKAEDPIAERLAYLDPELKAQLAAKKNGNGKSHLRAEVGAVQSYQWHVLNKSESWLTEAVRSEYAGSYMIERPFQEHLGSLKMVAGTAYMIRADLLRKLGWGRSLTEDWELTLRLYELGYKVAFTPYAEVPAECVATFGRLARQRMRWAEGHSFNVRRYFTRILRSKHLGWTEKFEFVYYSTYYLQAVFFLAGSLSWLLSEIVFKVHVPQWTALLGWSLLFSNLFALPLMNIGGLLLEGAPAKDFTGVAGAVMTSYLLIPFQAWAAVKGFLENEEGPWFRTPKTGNITDPVKHLRRLKKLRKWLFGNGNGKGGHGALQPAHIQSTPRVPRRPSRRLAWIVAVAMVAALGGLGVNALHAPVAYAAGTTFYLHNSGITDSPCCIDQVAPTNSGSSFSDWTIVGRTLTWPSSTTVSAQTVAAGTYTFTYWTGTTTGNNSATVTMTFGYSADSACSSITTIASWSFQFHDSAVGLTTSTTTASSTAIPGGSYLCWQGNSTAVQHNGEDWDCDATTTACNLNTPTITIPELGLALLGLALVAPIAARRRPRPFFPAWLGRRPDVYS
jgi:hypothetical protein